MLTTTAQWPSAGNAIATIFDDGISKRPKRSGGSYMRVTTVDFARGFRRQISAKRAILTADLHTPARRTIGPRDFFDDANERHRIGFFAPQSAGYPQTK